MIKTERDPAKFALGAFLSAVALGVSLYMILSAISAYLQWIAWGLLVVLTLVAGYYANHRHDLAKKHREHVAKQNALIEEEIQAAQVQRELEKKEREQALRIEQERWQLEQHVALTRVPPDASGYYPYLLQEQQIIPLEPFHQRLLPERSERPATRREEEEAEPVADIPTAPAFPQMQHLITQNKMPLCWVSENGRSVPAYGTVDDLLSMAITGKPGRGKTTALMYYVCTLLTTGAEVWVWDPHGVMGELAGLNGQTLPGVPPTAKIVYLDRREDIVASIPQLHTELDQRDELYRATRRVKHPLLILADELPVLASYDEATAAEYKQINKQRQAGGKLPVEPPIAITLIKRVVLEARKWRCFFIGSGQTFDAEVLPTKVTENFNSRVVFFSSDRRARMSGLENDVIKDLLPQIRRAGSGVMIFDCSRWDSPVIGAIPKIDVEDMMEFLQGGTNRDEPETMPPLPYQHVPEKPQGRIFLREMVHETGPLTNGSKTLVDAFPDGPETVPSSPNLGPDDKELDADQARLFSREYRRAMQKGSADIKAILRAIGVGNRYYRHAAFLAGQIK